MHSFGNMAGKNLPEDFLFTKVNLLAIFFFLSFFIKISINCILVTVYFFLFRTYIINLNIKLFNRKIHRFDKVAEWKLAVLTLYSWCKKIFLIFSLFISELVEKFSRRNNLSPSGKKKNILIICYRSYIWI